MSQPKIMTVPKDETLVAFGTMNGIVYAIAKSVGSDLYGTYIWSWGYIGSSISSRRLPWHGKKLYYWRSIVVTYTLDDALYRLDNVTGRLANLNL